MENREILVANTKTQKRYKLTTDATTLSELKAAMDAANIDYSDMTFTEGISKTQLLDDATQLPKDIMYKGATTNNLIILLTNTKKNIASGMDRQTAYATIKSHNLQDKVKELYGKNYTVVSTDKLVEIIQQYAKPHPVTLVTPVESPTEGNDKPAPKATTPVADDNLLNSVKNILITLEKADFISPSQLGAFADEILDYLEEDCEDDRYYEDDYEEDVEENTSVSTSDGSITDKDIDDILDDMGI